ncbi:MAG: NTP transferase domain-containing protein [Xanthomonadales bacterium]|nr:NTP transferase domain-containing protein [Xanthomonadales bacterium]NIN60471.1 NTP transferase domain-containing protein [Xanthomonadales bacterium]NIN75824.1 NTP transferase domain-containing protein [Xanthomonadales bacterium]NIP12864.1 NTP transferase domain-containing protein [Xanthomonadales bacterium]NIP75175.1 NTP transferase domain-containing protein [Xanthomonadales bacterium]
MTDRDPAVAGLLLAAGGSRRLGQPKQLLRLGDASLVARGAAMLAQVCGTVIVVTGAHAKAVEAALAGLRAVVVRNPEWRQGQGRSIACAMHAVPQDAAALLVLLCDQWRVTPACLETLVAAWRAAPERIVAARWADAFGPPVIFPARSFGSLARLRGPAGGKALLAAATDTLLVELPLAGYDIDAVSDLAQLHAAGPDGQSR